MAESFFNALPNPDPTLGYDQLRVLLGEGTKTRIALNGLAPGWEFIRPDMAGVILALLPELQPEIVAGVLGTVGMVVLGEFAKLHAGNLGDFTEDLSRRERCFHLQL